ncbi:MFS transporter [Streptomyces lusitanus]|uniref:MFS transporter n=1 Tax=Streptomyces lusitanus TaxID=68232 RepID=A0ABU3JMT5_9ACTN|nr:MFS transporter [Streptomyces lusitanus]
MWRDRSFRRLWAGQTASQFGEHTAVVVLPLVAVVTLGAEAGQLGVLRAVSQAPVLLLALFVGAWVDRWRTRTVMAAADAGRAVVLGAVSVAAVTGRLNPASLAVAAVAVGTLSVFFDVAYQASAVRLVAREELVRANSALEGSRSAAQTGGPALGGGLVSLLSAPVAAACGAVFFAVSFLSVRRIRRAESVPGTAPGGSGVWSRMRDGWRFVVGDAVLRAVCLASAAFQCAFSAATTVYLLFLPRDLALPGAAVGVVLAAVGPGALLGSVLAARLPRRFGYGRVLVAAAAVGDGVWLCLPALRGAPSVTVPVLCGVGLVFGAGGQLVNVMVMAVRQTVTPDGMQARVAATITFVGMGTSPLGALLGGLLAETWGTRAALTVTAAGMLVSPAVMAVSPLGRLGRTLPPGCGGSGGVE